MGTFKLQLGMTKDAKLLCQGKGRKINFINRKDQITNTFAFFHALLKHMYKLRLRPMVLYKLIVLSCIHLLCIYCPFTVSAWSFILVLWLEDHLVLPEDVYCIDVFEDALC